MDLSKRKSRVKTFIQTFWCAVVTLCISMSGIAHAEEFDKTNPYPMMKSVAEVTFDRLAVEQELIQSNPEHLKVIVEEELMPYVNSKYAALKLLGTNVRKKGVKREDVIAFIQAFEKYLVTSYAQAMTQYTGQKILFEPEQSIAEDRRIMGVKVDIIDSPRPNIKIEFKLRKDKKTGEWLAFDMIVEGVSLLESKKSEWSSKLRQEGILAVAKEIEEMSQKPIVAETKQP